MVDIRKPFQRDGRSKKVEAGVVPGFGDGMGRGGCVAYIV